jgi:flagellar biosynthesis protein
MVDERPSRTPAKASEIWGRAPMADERRIAGVPSGAAGVADRKAVALSYRPAEIDAPVVSAKGSGHIARQIIEIAQANGVPVREDSDLVELLAHVDLDTVIPVDAFVAVAEILTYLYRLNGPPEGLARPAGHGTTGEMQ